MQIDQIDLKIIRALENGNRPFLTTIASQLEIKKEEVKARLEKIEAEGLIRSYKMLISIPTFLGGDWTLGCVLGITSDPTKVVSVLKQKLDFLIEVFHNLSFPDGIGPNLNLLFYTKDFISSTQIIRETKDFEFVEIHKLQEYSFPVPTILSSAEQRMLRKIYTDPLAQEQELADSLSKEVEWIQEKFHRLFTDPNGIGRILPELDWRVCENFSHIHFLIVKGTESNLAKESASTKTVLKPVFTSQPFRDRFYQFETDIWGINDFKAKVKMLEEAGAKVKGFILAETNQVINDWISECLSPL